MPAETPAGRPAEPSPLQPWTAVEVVLLRRRLRNWYRKVARRLPWRATQDPYRIWIAEIMLQQTRVATVEPYYRRFVERFPSIATLASAPVREVLSCWSGLGYYRRAHHLHQAARIIAENGGFPQDYAGWRALPGVGRYTAAAIASIAFGHPHPVLDGNVMRVLSRVAAERRPIHKAATRRRLETLAARLLDPRDPGAFNQALMELGATRCRARAPQCTTCPIASHCRARGLGIEQQLPVRGPRPERFRLEKTLLVVEHRGRVLLRACAGARLGGLWELPEQAELAAARPLARLGRFRHAITRYEYYYTVMRAELTETPAGFGWFSKRDLDRLPLTAAARKALALSHPGVSAPHPSQ